MTTRTTTVCDVCSTKECAYEAHQIELLPGTGITRLLVSIVPSGKHICLHCVIDTLNQMDDRPKPSVERKTKPNFKCVPRTVTPAMLDTARKASLNYSSLGPPSDVYLGLVWQAMYDAT